MKKTDAYIYYYINVDKTKRDFLRLKWMWRKFMAWTYNFGLMDIKKF